jgi:hypothetical protein
MPEASSKIEKVDVRGEDYRGELSDQYEDKGDYKTANIFGQRIRTATGLISHISNPDNPLAIHQLSRLPVLVNRERNYLTSLRNKLFDSEIGERARILKSIYGEPARRFSQDQIELRLAPILDLLEEGEAANPKSKYKFQLARKRALKIYDRTASDFISPSLITGEMFVKMVEKHGENFEARSAEIESEIPSLKISFAEYFKKFAVAEGIEIPKDLIDERIDETEVFIVDPLISKMQEIGGEYSEGAIRIDGALKEEFLYIVFAHEMLHALSGRTVISKRLNSNFSESEEAEEFDYENESRRTLKTQRVGFHFSANKPSRRRFFWLNEAITEELTHKIRPDVDYNSYLKERAFFEALRTCGKRKIPEVLFYNAYFENYNPNLPYGERIPHWKKLMQAIDGEYEPGFLVKMDKAIKAGLGMYLSNYLRSRYNGDQSVNVIPYEKSELDKIFGGGK